MLSSDQESILFTFTEILVQTIGYGKPRPVTNKD